MMLDIKKANLNWNGKLKKLNMAKIKYIMVHHTAHPSWDVYSVHNFHKNTNGWIGIGYNFFINRDGTIFEGRGLNVGAGATGYNYNSIHVCFAGNFENTNPTQKQLESGRKLIEYLLTLVPSDVKIVGHKDIGRTACPGKKFPLDSFKNIKKEVEDEKMLKELSDKYGEENVKKALTRLVETVNAGDVPDEWAKEELTQAIEKKITDGTKPKMFVTRQEVAIMINRSLEEKK